MKIRDKIARINKNNKVMIPINIRSKFRSMNGIDSLSCGCFSFEIIEDMVYLNYIPYNGYSYMYNKINKDKLLTISRSGVIELPKDIIAKLNNARGLKKNDRLILFGIDDSRLVMRRYISASCV